MTIQNIKEIIAKNSAEAALEKIESFLKDPGIPSDFRADILAEKGKLLWKLNRRGEALSAYEEGALLLPEGQASLLLEHSRSIMDFFNPDLLNP